MAIARVTSVIGNNSSAVTSFALPSTTTALGRVVVFAIVLGSTSSSVSSITNSAGAYTYTFQTAVNGTGVRVEIWTATVGTAAATVFTVNITGGATTVAATAQQYSGVSAFGNTNTGSGSSFNGDITVLTQQGNDWVGGGLGFACVSGDTLTTTAGTLENSSIPAATAVGLGYSDQSSTADQKMRLQTRISNSRAWAFAAIELESGSSAITAASYGGATMPTLNQPRDVRYLFVEEPLFCVNQNYPPMPGVNNYGSVG